MIAHTAKDVDVPPQAEVEILSWTSDGVKELIGFLGSGTYSAEYRLYVGSDPAPWYVYQTSPGNRTAYVADRATVVPAGQVVSLKVYHESTEGPQAFRGTLLGG